MSLKKIFTHLDFERLHVLHCAGSFFVTRAKSNMDTRRVYSRPADRATGVICDQSIALNGFYSSQHYPEHLRRIRYKDPESGKKARVPHQPLRAANRKVEHKDGHTTRESRR